MQARDGHSFPDRGRVARRLPDQAGQWKKKKNKWFGAAVGRGGVEKWRARDGHAGWKSEPLRRRTAIGAGRRRARRGRICFFLSSSSLFIFLSFFLSPSFSPNLPPSCRRPVGDDLWGRRGRSAACLYFYYVQTIYRRRSLRGVP